MRPYCGSQGAIHFFISYPMFSKTDHNKVLTCEAQHKDTSTELRTSLTLNVLCKNFFPDFPTYSLSMSFFASSLSAGLLIFIEVVPTRSIARFYCWRNSHFRPLICPKASTKSFLDSSEKPTIDIVGEKNSVKIGQNVTLLCSAASGNPPPSLTWHLNEKPIPSPYEYDFVNQVDFPLLFSTSSSPKVNSLSL